METDTGKLTIVGAGVGIFLISFGIYGLIVENDQKINQAEQNQILSEAINRLNEATYQVEHFEKKCLEDTPKENKQEYSECISILKQARLEQTSAQNNYYETKNRLGLE